MPAGENGFYFNTYPARGFILPTSAIYTLASYSLRHTTDGLVSLLWLSLRASFAPELAWPPRMQQEWEGWGLAQFMCHLMDE